jgi:hypothetical protein
MAFEFRRDDATRESYVAALFDCWNVQNIQVVLQITHTLLPMGVIDLHFADNEVKVLLSAKGSRLRLFIFLQVGPLSSGALIRPYCITILYHNLRLFIDIFHIWIRYLYYFLCFYMIDDHWRILWGPRITYPKYPICIQFTIPWSVCRESTYPSW